MRPILGWSIAVLCLAVMSPAVRADTLDSLHCNDAHGVPVLKGRAVTMTGIVTAQFSTAKSARLYIQGPNGAVNVFGAPTHCALIGDSLRVSGTVGAYNGLTELMGSEEAPIAIEALGHGQVPAPFPIDLHHLSDLETAAGCEPNESRLVSIGRATIRTIHGEALADTARFREDTTYLIAPVVADSAFTGMPMRVLAAPGCPGTTSIAGQPIPRGPVQVIGILSQYLARGATHGGYQLLPRGLGDFRPVAPKPAK